MALRSHCVVPLGRKLYTHSQPRSQGLISSRPVFVQSNVMLKRMLKVLKLKFVQTNGNILAETSFSFLFFNLLPSRLCDVSYFLCFPFIFPVL